LSALRALNGNFYTLADSRGLRCRNCREPFILCLLTWLAALGLISQTLIMKENLFSGCPNKVFSTIYAFYCAILVFSFGVI